MGLFSKIDRHSALANRMADTVGADLVKASSTGAAPETALRSAIFSCMKCDQTEACKSWLNAHTDGAEQTPDYCRNKALLDRLGKL